MGKSGKAKKRLRQSNEYKKNVLNSKSLDVVPAEVDSHSNSDSDFDTDDDVVNEDNIDSKVYEAMRVIEIIANRTDIYSSKPFKVLRTALFPLIKLQMNKFFETAGIEANPSMLNDENMKKVLCLRNITTTVEVAQYFVDHVELFNSVQYKCFRKCIHPLVLHHKNQDKGAVTSKTTNGSSISAAGSQYVSQQDGKVKLTTLISNYFHTKQWNRVLDALYELACNDNECPKLGSLQRWVRECDIYNPVSEELKVVGRAAVATALNAETCEKNSEQQSQVAKQLLFAVLKVMVEKNRVVHQHLQPHLDAKLFKEKNTFTYPAVCIRHPDFDVYATKIKSKNDSICIQSKDDARAFLMEFYPGMPVLKEDFVKNMLTVVSHVAGPDRRPPVEHDLNIYMNNPSAIKMHATMPTKRHDIPNVPGAFIMTDVMAIDECAQLMLAAEKVGYLPDTVEGIEGQVWLAERSFLDQIEERVRQLMPAHIHGCAFAGVNARFRFFRYSPGVEYRPHIDGAWPGSGLLPNGDFVDDAFNGEKHTKLTFLFYLNGGFEGGATTFFLPGNTVPVSRPNPEAQHQYQNVINANGIKPYAGCVVCFPHGSAIDGLVHEGSAVKAGVKYVIRTDALYMVKPDSNINPI